MHKMLPVSENRLFLIGALCTVLVEIGIAQNQMKPSSDEIWANPGVGPAAPIDLVRFVSTLDASLIGVYEGASVAYVDKEHTRLLTTLTFRVDEVVFARGPYRVGDQLNVVTPGGWYRERAGIRTATRPAEIAAALQPGAKYLIPVLQERRDEAAWVGKDMLAWPDALVRLEGDSIFPVKPQSKWLREVLASRTYTAGVPGPPLAPRALLVGAIRTAASAAR
jgi:hypothetical protein